METHSAREPWKDESLMCRDLPTEPAPDIGTVLVTGPSGYIGGRLVPELIARGYRVRIMMRGAIPPRRWPDYEITDISGRFRLVRFRIRLNGESVNDLSEANRGSIGRLLAAVLIGIYFAPYL